MIGILHLPAADELVLVLYDRCHTFSLGVLLLLMLESKSRAAKNHPEP